MIEARDPRSPLGKAVAEWVGSPSTPSSWLPGWLDRILPNVAVDPPDEPRPAGLADRPGKANTVA
jgi:hypothetical protein